MKASSDLKVGLARRLIDPMPGIFLIGYGDRTKGNQGIHDDLTATALVLDDGSRRIAIVALDMLAINEYIVDRVREKVDPIALILCCSHTHSGPIAYAGKGSPRKDREFIDFLVSAIAAVVMEAAGKLAPARLTFSSGQAGIAVNRRERMPDGHIEIGRNPNGVVDSSLQIVNILKVNGERMGTLINYACHGTVLGPDNLLVSADWIGAMRQEVEAKLGGMALFVQGATANLNPNMYWGDPRSYEMVHQQGLRVAEEVVKTASQPEREISILPLALARKEVWLPTEARVLSRRPPKNYGRGLLRLAKLPAWMTFLADPLLNKRYPWRSRIAARDGAWSVPMRLNALRVGDLALVTYGAETFTEIGMKVKAASPAKFTLFVSLTDGCISYLHTAEAHAEGGYEVDVAPLAYRFPGRLASECELIATTATQEVLTGLWNQEAGD